MILTSALLMVVIGYLPYRLLLLMIRYLTTVPTKRRLHQASPLSTIGFNEAKSSFYLAETTPSAKLFYFIGRLIAVFLAGYGVAAIDSATLQLIWGERGWLVSAFGMPDF